MAVDKSALQQEIHYLFRFRDLIAPTIVEHRKMIEDPAKSACWWGWWKRPTEDARPDIWSALEKDATEKLPLRIGLFNSGTGNVYGAWVSKVIKPLGDPNSAPPLPKDDEELVPEYYRKSPFSRAWMRMVDIEEKPIEFFDKYSFDQAPPLSNYSDAVLRRLKDKVIKTADELRGMDTTIWTVRARRGFDHDEVILLTTRALSLPVSRDSVDLQRDTILHISDPHFATGKHRSKHIWALESETSGRKARPTLAEAISLALNKKPVGLILITGDLTFTGEEEEFGEAATSITRLLGNLNLDKDRLVIIPGNHDIRWTKMDDYDPKAKITEAPEEAKKTTRVFIKSSLDIIPTRLYPWADGSNCRRVSRWKSVR